MSLFYRLWGKRVGFGERGERGWAGKYEMETMGMGMRMRMRMKIIRYGKKADDEEGGSRR